MASAPTTSQLHELAVPAPLVNIKERSEKLVPQSCNAANGMNVTQVEIFLIRLMFGRDASSF